MSVYSLSQLELFPFLGRLPGKLNTLTKDVDIQDVRGLTPEQVFSLAGVAALVVPTDVPDLESPAAVEEVNVALDAVVGDRPVLE